MEKWRKCFTHFYYCKNIVAFILNTPVAIQNPTYINYCKVRTIILCVHYYRALVHEAFSIFSYTVIVNWNNLTCGLVVFRMRHRKCIHAVDNNDIYFYLVNFIFYTGNRNKVWCMIWVTLFQIKRSLKCDYL